MQLYEGKNIPKVLLHNDIEQQKIISNNFLFVHHILSATTSYIEKSTLSTVF